MSVIRTTWGKLTPEQKANAIKENQALTPGWGEGFEDDHEILIMTEHWKGPGPLPPGEE